MAVRNFGPQPRKSEDKASAWPGVSVSNAKISSRHPETSGRIAQWWSERGDIASRRSFPV
ncbi:UNVERIFIED_CONTAM: hypothetical protein Sangu_2591000 [Sesamum angustifolium]|uniref:Uncharacterized protein n=1 Tax=Sesamum angustifolium TaxID=2727405 RepID=A0AAW2J928_9LAMI